MFTPKYARLIHNLNIELLSHSCFLLFHIYSGFTSRGILKLTVLDLYLLYIQPVPI